MPHQRHLASVAVQVDADLAFDDKEELRACVALAEHRLALHVVARDHQAIDARQLVEGERAEERHPLQRDQLFHLLIQSVHRRFRRFANPPVGMSGKPFELGLRQGTRQNRVERIRLEQAGQWGGQPTRAEV